MNMKEIIAGNLDDDERAMMIVGTAAVCCQFNKWDQLRDSILAHLKASREHAIKGMKQEA